MNRPNRNFFDMSHDVKLSCDMGKLVPTLCMECVPGDKFNIGCESLLRFAPLVSPVMHEMNVYMHYFFVPCRILWDNWEDYITNTGTPLPAFPYLNISDAGGLYAIGGLLDYMGIPDPQFGDGATVPINALPFAAYQAIYNEYYRDENLVAEVNYKVVDGNNAATAGALLGMRLRAWEHDYFTAALPFAQKGDPVSIPLGNVELVPGWDGSQGNPHFAGSGGGSLDVGNLAQALVGAGPDAEITINATTESQAYDPDGTLIVGSTTIQDLRRAFRLQEWLEIQARAGTRYIESILGHFGVRSSDKRLQRPEYITGTKSPVRISEVLNTGGDTAVLPQGTMAGHGLSYTSGKYGSYFCEEHGFIIGIMSIIPRSAYYQGIPKMFLKTVDPFQHFWPKFANIGEQEIVNNELFGFNANGGDTFGYIPRYSEYKYMPSRVAGVFRTTLDFWHLGRTFFTPPTLSQQFIEVDPGEQTRIFAVTTGSDDKLYVHVFHRIKASRLMPKYGTPTF